MAKIFDIAMMVFCMSVLLVPGCGQDAEEQLAEPVQEEEPAVQEDAVQGDVIEGEYVEVRALDDNESVYKDPMDVLEQARAAQESGQNVNIHIG